MIRGHFGVKATDMRITGLNSSLDLMPDEVPAPATAARVAGQKYCQEIRKL